MPAAPPAHLELLRTVCIASAAELRGLPLRDDTPDGRHRLLAQQALRWTYVVRSRQRWIHDASLRERLEQDARGSLALLGVGPDQLNALSREPVLVVRVPYQHEALGWEGRILPWEYLLAAATRAGRRGPSGRPNSLTVIRELQVQHEVEGRWVPELPRPVPLPAAHGLRALFVNTLPRELRETFSVEDEAENYRRALPAGTTWQVLDFPSLDELALAVATLRPQLLHFAGLDAHQGVRELLVARGDAAQVEVADWAPGRRWHLSLYSAAALQADKHHMVDGLLLRGSGGQPQLVQAQRLAQALARGVARDDRVYLTTLNLWNSAARLAPLLIAEGATLAAVGFQDAFDDSLAEFTVTQLLRGLVASGFDLPAAFEQAWRVVRELPESVDATAVTLWVGAPVLVDAATRERHAVQRARAAQAAPPAPPARASVQLQIEPFAELNYSALHNAQPLFKRFLLSCDAPERAEPLDIEVAVHMGMEQARFQQRLEMRHHRENLTQRIHVPLTADIARGRREAVNSTLRVRVAQGGHVLYDDSHRLRLMPVDQWRDSRHDGRWLPSFVLPRDPMVARAMLQAQRYNRVLRDDPAAGFEGYQCVPAGDLSEEALRAVDQQVQAIWSTLLHDWQIGYINPPPTYSDGRDSQRLRMPSTVHAERAGTCIDLALLFAACLELIDIYPVIFLLDGHALPGWWRHPAFRDEYVGLRPMSYDSMADAGGDAATDQAQAVSWQAGKASWPEVRAWIREGKLVPIETVRLTEQCGFVEAVEAGVAALSRRDDFESMLDILTARNALVTPLPVIQEDV